MGVCMRHAPQIEWEVLEAEDDEWAGVALTATMGEGRSLRWQRLTTALGIAALLIGLAGITGYRLWQDAEAGIAATERHIGTLVQVETIRRQPLGATRDLSTALSDVRVKGNSAMVRVVVTETLSLGQILPHVETRFYERYPAGWRRTAPIAVFWGDAAQLDTATLHFDFYELDRPYVEAVAVPIEAYHSALRSLLGLLPLAATERITIAVAAQYVAPNEVLPDGTLIELSPYLYLAAPPGYDQLQRYAEAGMTFLHRLQGQLLWRSLQECWTAYGPREVWQPMMGYLDQWLRDHAAELPALAGGAPLQDESRIVKPAHAIAVLTGDYVSNAHFSKNGGYADQPIAFSVHALFDFLVADRGPGAIPSLLQAFSTEETWSAVIEEAYGLSMGEFQAEWDGYVQRSKNAETVVD